VGDSAPTAPKGDDVCAPFPFGKGSVTNKNPVSFIHSGTLVTLCSQLTTSLEKNVLSFYFRPCVMS